MPHSLVGNGAIVTDIKVKDIKDQKVASFLLIFDDFGQKLALSTTVFSRGFTEKQWDLLTSQKKGQTLYVEGRLKNNEYEKDGNKVKVINFILSRFDFIRSGKKSEDNPEPTTTTNAPATSAKKTVVEDPDDIPF